MNKLWQADDTGSRDFLLLLTYALGLFYVLLLGAMGEIKRLRDW